MANEMQDVASLMHLDSNLSNLRGDALPPTQYLESLDASLA